MQQGCLNPNSVTIGGKLPQQSFLEPAVTSTTRCPHSEDCLTVKVSGGKRLVQFNGMVKWKVVSTSPIKRGQHGLTK